MRATAANKTDNAQEKQQPSELMGFRALGVVMGPLMLGKLLDQLQLPSQTTENAPRSSIDSLKKGEKKSEKKQKRNSISDKLGRDAELSAYVDRANATAAVMERLLVIWKDVVLQLRLALDENGSMSASSRQHLGSSEEGVLFMDMLKAGPPGTHFSGTFKMKSKVKVGKSPMSRGSRKASSDPFESLSPMDSSRDLPSNVNKNHTSGHIIIEDADAPDEDYESDATESVHGHMATGHDLQEDQRTKSDIAMDQMSMGTILSRPQESSVMPSHRVMIRSVSLQPNQNVRPQTPQADLVSIGTPETALREITKQPQATSRGLKRSGSSLDKPLPPIGAAQRAEMSPRTSNELNVIEGPNGEFRVRQPSLPQDKEKQRQPSSNSVRGKLPFNGSSPTIKPRSRSSATQTRRKVSQYDINEGPEGKLFPMSFVQMIPRLFCHLCESLPSRNCFVVALDLPDTPFVSTSSCIGVLIHLQ